MKKSIRQVDVNGKKVLVRVDFNVPLTEDGKVADDTRVRAALPTLRYLLEHGAAVILMSHLGRPKGVRVESMSLRPVADSLARLLDRPIIFAEDCVGPIAEDAAARLKPGQVLLLENLRFHQGETKNDPEFAAKLGKLADLYVNDAFGTAHRAHASTVGVTEHLPAVAGLLMEEEIRSLGRLLDPERPFVAILGGAKVSDKLPIIRNLVDRVDQLLIGGGMANTFLKALGYSVGKSLVEDDQIDNCKKIIKEFKDQGKELLLPIDVVVANFFMEEADHKEVRVDAVPEDWLILDIGSQTAERFAEAARSAKTVFWNGPMGVAEWQNFARGTERMAVALGEIDAYTVVGGGDSVAAVARFGLEERFDHVSTGGGASLEFVAGEELPAVVRLEEAD